MSHKTDRNFDIDATVLVTVEEIHKAAEWCPVELGNLTDDTLPRGFVLDWAGRPAVPASTAVELLENWRARGQVIRDEYWETYAAQHHAQKAARDAHAEAHSLPRRSRKTVTNFGGEVA